MRVINACDQIHQFFENGTFTLPAWRRYAAHISPLLPQLCEADIVDYDFDSMVLPVIHTALGSRKRLAAVNVSFRAVVDKLEKGLHRLFPDGGDFTLILYLGLCCGAGWVTKLGDDWVVLLGVEKILELDWDDEASMRGLIFHEIGHVWHYANGFSWPDHAEPRDAALLQLYEEGVAMVCEQILCSDEMYYHQDKNGWLEWCLENEASMKKEYLRRMEQQESIQDFFGDWCSYRGHSDVGYFLGCQFIRHLAKKYALEEIACLPLELLHREFILFAK